MVKPRLTFGLFHFNLNSASLHPNVGISGILISTPGYMVMSTLYVTFGRNNPINCP